VEGRSGHYAAHEWPSGVVLGGQLLQGAVDLDRDGAMSLARRR
jgi:hypothetical protein